MSPIIIGLIAFASLFVLIMIGIPIAFAVGLVGLFGLVLFLGFDKAIYYAGMIPYSEIAVYAFTVLPMFMLMGYFFDAGGYAGNLFYTARRWVGRLPGGLAIATSFGGAAFGAACGSSVAASAILGKICIPEMEKSGYNPGLASGSVASCANLATMIPPSSLMVIYTMMTEASLGRLLIAGILPGIILAFGFATMIYVRSRLNPNLAPVIKEKVSWKEKFLSLKSSWSILIIIVIVIGGIYSGILTPTEAGAAGALGTLLMALIPGKLPFAKFKQSLLDSAQSTSMVFFIVMGAMIFARFLNITSVPQELALFLSSQPIPPVVIIIGICLIYFILGMFIDAASMMIVTLPVFFPLISRLGYDPIWFGIIVVLMAEVGLITPPVGINCYVVAGVAPHIPIETVFRGILPFLVVDIIILAILIAFPSIPLLLPNMMFAPT